jgi:uncharacterized protein Yka (UPF0111/DUF47 family)
MEKIRVPVAEKDRHVRLASAVPIMDSVALALNTVMKITKQVTEVEEFQAMKENVVETARYVQLASAVPHMDTVALALNTVEKEMQEVEQAE